VANGIVWQVAQCQWLVCVTPTILPVHNQRITKSTYEHQFFTMTNHCSGARPGLLQRRWLAWLPSPGSLFFQRLDAY
jgi:hypothetical protein